MSKIITGIVLVIGVIVAGLYIDQYWPNEPNKIHLILLGILIGIIISGISVVGILIAKKKEIIQ